jgi:hypothetical protein
MRARRPAGLTVAWLPSPISALRTRTRPELRCVLLLSRASMSHSVLVQRHAQPPVLQSDTAGSLLQLSGFAPALYGLGQSGLQLASLAVPAETPSVVPHSESPSPAPYADSIGRAYLFVERPTEFPAETPTVEVTERPTPRREAPTEMPTERPTGEFTVHPTRWKEAPTDAPTERIHPTRPNHTPKPTTKSQANCAFLCVSCGPCAETCCSPPVRVSDDRSASTRCRATGSASRRTARKHRRSPA